MEEVSKETRSKTWLIASLVGISTFLNGFDMGALGAVIVLIREDWDLNAAQIGGLMSIFVFGEIIGAFFITILSDFYQIRISRRWYLIHSLNLFALGCTLSYIAPGFTSLLLARLLIGFSCGIAIVVSPVYLGECSPPSMRGSHATLLELAVNFGIALSQLVCYLVIANTNNDNHSSWLTWRMIISVPGIPALFVSLAIWLQCPNSPRFVLFYNDNNNNNDDGKNEAKRVLINDLHYSDARASRMVDEMIEAKEMDDHLAMNDIYFWSAVFKRLCLCKSGVTMASRAGNGYQMANIEHDNAVSANEASSSSSSSSSFDNHGLTQAGYDDDNTSVKENNNDNHHLVSIDDERVVFASSLITLGVCIASLNQATGVDAIMMYSPTIFHDYLELSKRVSILWISVIAMIKFVTCIIPLMLSDIYGRRWFLKTSVIGMATLQSIMILILIIASFIEGKGYSGFGAVNENGSVCIYAWITSVLIWNVFFSLGAGPMLWVYLSELFPVSIKSTSVALCFLANRLFSAMNILLFPILRQWITVFPTMFAWLLSSLMALVLIERYLPETAQQSIESIFVGFYRESQSHLHPYAGIPDGGDKEPVMKVD